MQRVGGFRRKTRTKLMRAIREKGKIPLSRYFQKLIEGEKVLFHANPAVQGGQYFPRFHGRMGTVVAKRGTCYEVTFFDGNKKKLAIVHPIHLRKVKQ